LLGLLLDRQLLKNARSCADLFSSWQALTEELGEPRLAEHSRIRECERSVLLIEADHPGWIQMLQIKRQDIFEKITARFPEMGIQEIDFCLSRSSFHFQLQENTEQKLPGSGGQEDVLEKKEKNLKKTLEKIQDGTLKDALKRLEKTVTAKNQAEGDEK